MLIVHINNPYLHLHVHSYVPGSACIVSSPTLAYTRLPPCSNEWDSSSQITYEEMNQLSALAKQAQREARVPVSDSPTIERVASPASDGGRPVKNRRVTCCTGGAVSDLDRSQILAS